MDYPLNDYANTDTAIESVTRHLDQEQIVTNASSVENAFREWAGITPEEFASHITESRIRTALEHGSHIMSKMSTDKPNSRIVKLLSERTHGKARKNNDKCNENILSIKYGTVKSTFGNIFLAATDDNIVSTSFLPNDQASNKTQLRNVIADLVSTWPNSTITQDCTAVYRIASQAFLQFHPYFQHQNLDEGNVPIRILVKGTDFQLKVWDALLRIPFGTLVSYQDIATFIGHPKAVRAVANAVGDNPVTYFIPCHRVIRKTGQLGGYHWGLTKKLILIGWELAGAKLKPPQVLDSERH